MTNQVFLLGESPKFPDADLAQEEPNGLLAIGGDLSLPRLVEAYRHGIFPWYSEGEPILWWSPDPRCVFFLENIHISRSMRRELKKSPYHITLNKVFNEVVEGCAAPRAKQPETWILPEMKQAYIDLHQQGFAHSIEVWSNEQLVGGLYGVSIGRFFFGESMFSQAANASKFALVYLGHYLKSQGFLMLDSQVGNPHLYSMGAVDLPRVEFLDLLDKHINWVQPTGMWNPRDLTDWR
ncbi:leucyl/phenylalanyl-tRNA--protein transferase [Kangiella sediminilitoris]|uniref:Leucyl/phenylalanyl-tRNA--protein transferase n=1 Tax=Kangiella sediminilitoris TaxID=1144748 RepID=A0A1B3BAA5_9GAMM|nr:leucyl/phenylalanyl-tRNA--protein transferase [Kangiella sediminilitoris]AOE49750.1 leucyl/phenylalanyl-tRNA--protein transferase [Kangiella sediminilitoris]